MRNPDWRSRAFRYLKNAVLALLLLGALAVIIRPSAAMFTETIAVGGNVFNADTLDPPTNLAGTPATTDGAVDLGWTATVDTYASGHRLFRSTVSGGPYSQIAEVSPRTTTAYQDSGLFDGKTYYYVGQSYAGTNWVSVDSAEAVAAAPGVLRPQADDVTLSLSTSVTGTIDTNHLATDYFTAAANVTYASNATDWTLVLVLRDKPTVDSPSTVEIWWQNGGACSSGVVAGQTFASGTGTVTPATSLNGVTLTIPKTAGTVTRTFVSGDLLCLSIRADEVAGANDLHYYANTASTSGTPGVTRLIGPFTTSSFLYLDDDDVTMVEELNSTGNIDTNNGATDYFTSVPTLVYASNDTDWTLTVVMKTKPTTATSVTLTVWWQNGGACSSGPVAGQIFATGDVTYPVAVDKQGVSFTIPKVAGTVSHTFVSGDILCFSFQNNGTAGANDIQYLGGTASTSGVSGYSRLEGPFGQ